MPSPLDAAKVFNLIPDDVRRSRSPIVTRLHPQTIHHSLGSNHQTTTQAVMAPVLPITNTGDWSSVGEVVSTAFARTIAEAQRCLARSTEDFLEHCAVTRIDDHFALLRAIGRGILPALVPPISDRLPPAEVKRRADLAGYVLVAGPSDSSHDRSASISFEAVRRVVGARLVPDIVHVTPQFVVPHDIGTHSPHVASLVDQLWIIEPGSSPNDVRLIAVVFSFSGSNPSPEESQCHEYYWRNGYEVFRINGWWSLVDPIRMLHDLLVAANLCVPRHLKKVFRGDAIRDCKCDSCGKFMIRDAMGYGIVEEGHSLVHEQCFNRFVDEGEDEST